MRRLLSVLALALALTQPARGKDYAFDLDEIEPKAYERNGFVQSSSEQLTLRPDAPLFPLAYPGVTPRTTLDRWTPALELAGTYRHGALKGYARLGVKKTSDAYISSTESTWLEAGVRLSPSEGQSYDLGKQVQRWGKGYAWNPVAFFERPKDPNDPTVSREGYVMATADWVRSLPGTISAIGLTPVLLPVNSGVNPDYGVAGHVNAGARLYLLAADTDIDLLWAAEGSRPERMGIDFSRNLGSALEVHGEWARTISASRRVLGSDGVVRTVQAHADSWLLGLRYLTEREVTWIVEYYRNALGYDEAELSTYYQWLLDAFGPSGSAGAQNLASTLAQSGYGRANPGRDYAYLRVSAKDPFDWLYFTPSLTAIVNLGDHSYQITPELLYTGWQDVELRLRAIWLQGGELSDFGAKPASRRLELLLRLYF